MDTTTAARIAGYGDNQPPASEMLRQNLEEKHLALVARTDQLVEAIDRAPAEVDDEETARKVSDFVKQLMAAHKNAEAARVAEKEPHLEAGRVVDGWFKRLTDPLAAGKKMIEGRLTLYQRKKADAERRAREEAERQARATAEAARQAQAAAEAAIKNERDLAAALEAERHAAAAQADAQAAAKAAVAKPAELSRTRGEYGAVASLRTFWDFSDLDRDAIDLEALRHHLPSDAIEKGLRSFIKAGGRAIRGARIFENTSTTVR